MLRRRLALYENPNTPPSRRRYPRRRSCSRSGRRYPDSSPPEEAARLVEEAKEEMLRLTREPYSSEEVSRFAVKIRNGVDHWFTFLTTPDVEPTNNRAERVLREHVLQRKIMETLRNKKGTFIHETIMTLLATWKQRRLNPSETLAATLSLKWQNS